jgi:hypothetical protein
MSLLRYQPWGMPELCRRRNRTVTLSRNTS